MKLFRVFYLLIFLTFPVHSVELDQYCTTSLAEGNFHKTDCSISGTFENKKYCFGNEKAKSIFLEETRETLTKALAFYEENNQIKREKITQEIANQILDDPDCDFSNKDVGYLNFNGTS